MKYQIVFSREAEEDLERLFDFAFGWKLNSPTGVLENPTNAIEAIRQACQFLAICPFSCRKTDDGPFVRELILPFGTAGYVVLFEIKAAGRVHIGTIRQQRESDYHWVVKHYPWVTLDPRLGSPAREGQADSWILRAITRVAEERHERIHGLALANIYHCRGQLLGQVHP